MCKNYTQNFRPKKKILKKNLTVLFVGQINQDF